jgi:hypothetical protein
MHDHIECSGALIADWFERQQDVSRTAGAAGTRCPSAAAAAERQSGVGQGSARPARDRTTERRVEAPVRAAGLGALRLLGPVG